MRNPVVVARLVPIRLQPGDTVGIAAPGFAVDRAALAAGVRALQTMGFRTRLGEHVRARDGYLAGDDDQRATDLNRMLSDDGLAAVWFARGGYGTARILDRVDWDALERRPKLLIGYSDLTALFNPVLERVGGHCLYGPVVTELGAAGTYDSASLDAALAGAPAALAFSRRQVLVHGRTRGRVYGGNLSVLAHLWGTPFAPELRRRVLFLEDVGEPLYRIDRCLTQLRSAGAFRGLAGVLLGGFAVKPRTHAPRDRGLLDVLRENFMDLGVPVVRGLPAGHVAHKHTVPLGASADIDTQAGRVEFRV